MSELRHLWFSKKASEYYERLATYRREDGSVVGVTLVTGSAKHGTGWDDMEYLGVGSFVSGGKLMHDQARVNTHEPHQPYWVKNG